MDRHQGEGLTKQEIAEQHVAHVKIQDKHNFNFMTYWYDEDRGELEPRGFDRSIPVFEVAWMGD